MEDKRKGLLPNKPQKPSLQVWLIASMVLAVLALMFYGRSSTVTIDLIDYENMMKAGDVEEITIINNKTVEVKIREEVLK